MKKIQTDEAYWHGRRAQQKWVKGLARQGVERKHFSVRTPKEGANKRGNSSRLTQSFHFFMFEPIF
ncbi:hypothetical protein, partial [Aeromonas caviae]|uniref:hypothetical protein n=1 Tax=Aeromonas caviae TaxID=648 RepID=UPI0029DCAF76